jgi:hypothetical protein
MWQCVNVGMWECDNVGMWQCGNVAMWQCGNVIICQFDDVSMNTIQKNYFLDFLDCSHFLNSSYFSLHLHKKN